MANIVPIFKKRDGVNPGNYCSVNLTCIVAKVFESILCDSITDHFIQYGLIANEQHGLPR